MREPSPDPSAGRPADPFDVDLERAEATLLRQAGSGPRYTSYPTAPAWSERYDARAFREDLAALDPAASPGLSLYVHVPFCRSLCHFCACNRVITRKPEPPARYLDAIVREIAAVREALPAGAAPVVQHHWGGGTPTHLQPAQITRLFGALSEAFPHAADAEISIEVDPRVTTEAHLDALRACGFHRISLGVQDFDPRVQEAVHRIQPVAQTAALVESARRRGFDSVNLDLIYGLPVQTQETFARTLEEVVAIAPDRIALYGYAHVTWVAKQQRGFERKDLPSPRARIGIFVAALRRLREAGYLYIGLDHFARPGDELARALAERTLRRNFMGYTTREGTELLGFGPSAISELTFAGGSSYAQSRRDLPAWHEAVEDGRLATLRGHRLSRDDLERRFAIQRLMCHGELRADEFAARFGTPLAERFPDELARLAPLEEDGLVRCAPDGSVGVTPLGRLVVRNVAMAFDAYLPGQQRAERPLFSQTV
ncbi:MAG: oxygen-independent coproporphyrinogen III oxidase [Myxococcota bacterium]|nr:oxygen-independent coproporphyrinogen III oxidase [Myxococcota bacterium]